MKHYNQLSSNPDLAHQDQALLLLLLCQEISSKVCHNVIKWVHVQAFPHFRPSWTNCTMVLCKLNLALCTVKAFLIESVLFFKIPRYFIHHFGTIFFILILHWICSCHWNIFGFGWNHHLWCLWVSLLFQTWLSLFYNVLQRWLLWSLPSPPQISFIFYTCTCKSEGS